MATLEKIRSKQKLLFTIVIIALFLFIISIASADSIRRLFDPTGTTIAEVGNQKIDYNDYRQLIDRINQQQQQQQQKADHDETAQLAIQQLISQALLKDQIEKLGINVTDAEISRAMTGQNPHPMAARFIQAVGQYLGITNADGATVLRAINNPSQFGLTTDQLNGLAQQVFGTYTMAQAWAAQEDQVEEYIQQQAFSSLIGGLFTANKLDAQAAYNDNSDTRVISYVSVPYAQVADNVEVSDAELKAKYEENKSQYRLTEETREVDYILVPIAPSKADYDAAEVEVDRVTEALAANPGIEGAAGATKFLQDSYNVPVSEYRKTTAIAAIPEDSIKKAGAVYKFNRMGNTFRIAKVLNVTPQIDEINISSIPVRDKAEADSLLNVLSQGTTFKALAESMANQGGSDSIATTLVGAPESLADVLSSAAVGQPFVYADSTQMPNPVLFVVNTRSQPKDYAEVVVFNYEVFPSTGTLTDIKTQLNGFLASNSKGDAFSANADSLYTLRHSLITPSTPMLGYAPSQYGRSMGTSDTRRAIKWAMNAKKGEVSPIFEDNKDYYVVVALKDIYDEYMPYTAPQVNDYLTAQVKADKKGDLLLERYAGKANDLPGYAQVMGVEVLSDSALVFAAPRFATLGGGEYVLQGQAAAAKPGTLVGPVKGNNEVVVFVIDSSKPAGREYNFNQDSQTFMNMFGIKDPYQLLLGDKKIKNNSLRFENNDR